MRQAYLLWVAVLLRSVHNPATLPHHLRHPVHRVVRLDLTAVQLGHVGDLVHMPRERLLGQQDLGLLVGLLGLALLEEFLDLLLEDGVLLGGFLGLATGLLCVEAGLELDLHVAGLLAVGHDGGELVSVGSFRR